MTQSAKSMSDWLLESAKKNPEGALLLAAGAVLLLRRSGAVSAISETSLAQTASESVRSAASSAKDLASDAVGTASQAGKDYVSETVSAVTERTNRAAQNTLSSVQSAVEKIVRDQPLLVAMAGIAAGAGLAAVFPDSDFEKNMLKPVSASVNDAANSVGEAAKDAFDRANEKFKEVAEERGLTTEGLKKMAGEVVSAAAPGIAKEAR